MLPKLAVKVKLAELANVKSETGIAVLHNKGTSRNISRKIINDFT